MKKYYPFIIYLAISVAIPIIIRQFLVTDLVIENKIESNEIYSRISLDIEGIKLSKTFHYFIEMLIVFFDFLIVLGIVIGVFKAFSESYKSYQILNIISEGYLIFLLGYLLKILYFMLLDDFSIDRFENYTILSLADFYNYEDVGKFKYLMFSNYNLFRLSSLIFITYSIYKITNEKIKISIILFLIIGAIYFLPPLIGI
jgi:hypothetical protein